MSIKNFIEVVRHKVSHVVISVKAHVIAIKSVITAKSGGVK